jgi:hypothetical protein
VVGDKPASHLTKAEIEDFMKLVARFPGPIVSDWSAANAVN